MFYVLSNIIAASYYYKACNIHCKKRTYFSTVLAEPDRITIIPYYGAITKLLHHLLPT